MPAIKALLRRTIATTTVNPPPILSPSATATTTHRQTLNLHSSIKQRSTLAKRGCVGLRVGGAHVKGVLTIIKQPISCNNNNNNNNNNIFRKRVYMLSSSSSSSSSFEERETDIFNNNNNNKEKKVVEEEGGEERVSVVEAPLKSLSLSSSSSSYIVEEMGNGNEENGVVLLSPPRKEEDQGKKEEEKCSKLFTLPTLLTLARVASVPVFIATFYVNSWWGATATTSIFVAAAITDWLDGYLARKMQLGTAFGAFLDPVADKLMVAATLVLLCSKPPEISVFGDIPWLFPVPAIAIIGREITMSAVREWAASQDAKLLQAVAVNNLGKWKTATQMIALTIILAIRDNSISSQGALAASGVGLLYISAGLAAWSLVVYMRKIWKVLMR